jgi:hypothetical protein
MGWNDRPRWGSSQQQSKLQSKRGGMNRIRIQLAVICAFAIVLVCASDVVAQNAKIDGKWDLVLHGENGTMTPTLTFATAGGKLTGTMKGGSDDMPLTGTIDGNKITFMVSPHGEGPFTFTGTVDGDSMKGTALIGEERDWTATRSKT